ncbi:MAG TPA: biotin/lipoate A/B protein ligase family protein [Acidimicrobiia bacterium]|jgi:lipoate-protein ligase A|nr:biotin/lipoate A/B protein ligase family protein [Acidimicrobiia bacterium]
MTESWRLLTDDGAEAAAGLALDEAMLAGYARDADPDWVPTLRLYTYRSHCALVGRYQHLEAEVDLDACRRTGTGFSRRPTGGGAIVMGAGQLGVAVATRAPADRNPRELLARYAEGIVAGLAELGIEASFAGKNDLSVARRKIAGLGLYLEPGGGLLFHSSILADLDIPFMLEVLNIPAAKLGDKAVAAVSERITTVSRETGRTVGGADIREVIATGFAKALGLDLQAGTTTPAEEARGLVLEAERYSSQDWCFEHSPQPDATATSVFKTPEGLVRCYLALHGPTIKSALFTGDFNTVPEPLARFEASLRWARLEEATLEKLAAISCPDGTGLGVAPSELVKAVLAAGDRAVLASEQMAAAPVRPSGSCYFPEDRS